VNRLPRLTPAFSDKSASWRADRRSDPTPSDNLRQDWQEGKQLLAFAPKIVSRLAGADKVAHRLVSHIGCPHARQFARPMQPRQRDRIPLVRLDALARPFRDQSRASSVQCSTKQPELGRFKREPASPRGCRSRKCSIRAGTGGGASSSYCRPSWLGGSIWRPRHGQPAPAGCHFGVILADARWRLESWGPKGQRRSASRHCDVLTPTRGTPRAGFAREQSDDAEEPPAAPPQ
jgi:hypothetical protein